MSQFQCFVPVDSHSHLNVHFIFITDAALEWKEQEPSVRGPELSPLLICENQAPSLWLAYHISQMQEWTR